MLFSGFPENDEQMLSTAVAVEPKREHFRQHPREAWAVFHSSFAAKPLATSQQLADGIISDSMAVHETDAESADRCWTEAQTGEFVRGLVDSFQKAEGGSHREAFTQFGRASIMQ